MSKRLPAVLLPLAAAGVLLSACGWTHPYIRDGDAKSVEVGYGEDVATTWPLARQHCAAYDRVPRLVDPGLHLAYFQCVPR